MTNFKKLIWNIVKTITFNEKVSVFNDVIKQECTEKDCKIVVKYMFKQRLFNKFIFIYEVKKLKIVEVVSCNNSKVYENIIPNTTRLYFEHISPLERCSEDLTCNITNQILSKDFKPKNNFSSHLVNGYLVEKGDVKVINLNGQLDNTKEYIYSSTVPIYH